jgi:protease IV
MSKFMKTMAVLAAVALVGFLFLMFAVVGAFTSLAEGGSLVREKRDHLTVLHVDGPIMASDAWLESIHRIAEDKACKGVLVRVDSPGGAVGASQEILSALKGLKAKGLPVVVSQGNLAASGGYYVSLAGDRIFANPGTLTGSIGVIMQFPEARALLDKIGVDMYTVKSGDLKDVGNFARKPTPAELAYLRAVVDDVYGQFLDDIVANRKVDRDSLLKVADGRVLTGREALAHGLVDTLGGFREAKAWLAAKAGLTGEPVTVREPPEKGWVENLLESRFGGGLTRAAEGLLPLGRQGVYFLWK